MESKHNPSPAQSKAAVIGANLHAVLALNALKKREDLDLEWILAENDLSWDIPSAHLILPKQNFQHLKGAENFSQATQVHLFFEDHRHESLESFLRNPRHSFSKKLPRPIRQKIESLCLWNDLTPTVLGEDGEPNYLWPQNNPESLKARKESQFYLVNRQHYLKEIAKNQAHPIRFQCLSVDQGDDHENTKLIFKAPHGSQSFNHLLWTSHYSHPKVEKASALKIHSRRRWPKAWWRSFTAHFPNYFINAIPPFSIWIVSNKASHEFLETASLKSACLFRVFHVVDNLLQIDILEVEGESLDQSLVDNPSQFLNAYCPHLKNADSPWTETRFDENILYDSPFPTIHSFSKDFDFWSGGPFGDLQKSLDFKALWSKSKIHAST